MNNHADWTFLECLVIFLGPIVALVLLCVPSPVFKVLGIVMAFVCVCYAWEILAVWLILPVVVIGLAFGGAKDTWNSL